MHYAARDTVPLRTGRFQDKPVPLPVAGEAPTAEWLREKLPGPGPRNVGAKGPPYRRAEFHEALIKRNWGLVELVPPLERRFFFMPAGRLLVGVSYPEDRLLAERFAQQLQADGKLG